MFEALKTIEPALNPQSFMMDMERAMICAARQAFPNAIISTC
jgi:hypothetical protein